MGAGGTLPAPALIATRVTYALANAGFLAVALTCAATLAPPGKEGRGLAVPLPGTTVATIVGVPGGSVLGTLLGRWATFWAVAALCLSAAVGILTGIPARPAEADDTAGLGELWVSVALVLFGGGSLAGVTVAGTARHPADRWEAAEGSPFRTLAACVCAPL